MIFIFFKFCVIRSTGWKVAIALSHPLPFMVPAWVRVSFSPRTNIFFNKNPKTNIFDNSIRYVNVRPYIKCSVWCPFCIFLLLYQTHCCIAISVRLQCLNKKDNLILLLYYKITFFFGITAMENRIFILKPLPHFFQNAWKDAPFPLTHPFIHSE